MHRALVHTALSPLHVDVVSKKKMRASLTDVEGGGFVTTAGPDSAYWYHQHSQWARNSAFKPWSPVLLKERPVVGKVPLGEQLPTALPSAALPIYLKHNLTYPVEAYLPADVAELQKLGPPVLKADPDRLDTSVTLPVLKKATHVAMDVVPKKEHVPTACSRSSELALGGTPPAGKLVNGRLSADTEETMSNSSLSTLSGVEDVGLAEDGKEGAPLIVPELQGLWVAFDRHSLGERARQDIMHEEAEPMSCKLGSMPKGGDMPSPRMPPPPTSAPASPPGTQPQPPPAATSPEVSVHGSPVNLCEAKEPAARSPQTPPKPPVEQHKMLLAA
ncbi:hypothetical protein HPB49_002076 [Dermacentor silvarum]|uniref:Uncharacterized protein n=1 Tax=Dermacentor silvarum TaxID=543639 RepID=A0ACB8D290_DERSI|nr:hypothetical protein HPB49_002076 [Dermacentor silvarum]